MFGLNSKKTGAIILSFVGFFAFGVFVGSSHSREIDKVYGVSNKESALTAQTDFEPFWKVWNLINEKYPGADEISDQDRIYGSIKGLTASLNDPYSTFFNPEENKLFQDDISGEFSGIGAEVGMKDNVLTIIAPLKDTPAYNAGLKPGDKILKIDDTVTNDLSVDEAIKFIRGKQGTTVTLTIYRDGEEEPREIKIVRDVINAPTLDTEQRGDGIFVATLYSFSANSSNLFRNAMLELAASKKNKLVLDLRGNPGGYLDSAVDIASWFLPAGKTVVSEDYGKDIKQNVYRSKGYDILPTDLKIVVLIDGGSASASEIVAGALQDNGEALLVGEQSYGKGSVQEVIDITTDTALKITIAKWLTPNGNSISEKGLTPDFVVPFTKEDAEKEQDPQMKKAIEILNK